MLFNKITRRNFLFKSGSLSVSLLIPSASLKAFNSFSSQSSPDISVATGGIPTNNTIEAIQALGGINHFVRKNDKVVIKPNCLTRQSPQAATTTHPDVVETVIKCCQRAGAREILVLSNDPIINFERNGIMTAANKAGVKVVAATSRDQYEPVSILRGRLLKNAEITKDVLNADVFINVPIAKHHTQAGLTIGMKNLMGIVWDRRFFHTQGLHQTIADLCTFIKPDLTVVDANRILVTNGPNGPGKIKETKAVIAGTDPLAVDTYCTRYFREENYHATYIQFAYEMGVGEMQLKKLNIKEFTIG